MSFKSCCCKTFVKRDGDTVTMTSMYRNKHADLHILRAQGFVCLCSCGQLKFTLRLSCSDRSTVHTPVISSSMSGHIAEAITDPMHISSPCRPAKCQGQRGKMRRRGSSSAAFPELPFSPGTAFMCKKSMWSIQNGASWILFKRY